MKDSRSDIRTAFEKEQSGYGPPSSLRRSVIETVSAQPKRQVRLQWLAGFPAVLFAALVIAGLLSSRLAGHTLPGTAGTTPPPTAIPATATTPTPDPTA